MLFDNLTTCPLTGLPVNPEKMLKLLNGSKQALYTFAPIGQAIFDRDYLVSIGHSIATGNWQTHLKLAASCRAAKERGQPPLLLTPQLFAEASKAPDLSFEEKQDYFLCLLYELGGNEHRKRNIFIEFDFTLACAEDAKELNRILESLLADDLLLYDRPNDTPNHWINGVRTQYYGVLPTSSGKAKAKTLSITFNQPANPMTDESLIRQQAHNAYVRATSKHYAFQAHRVNETIQSLQQSAQLLHRKEDKSLFLNEICELLNKELEEHKVTCTTKGSACPYEAGVHQVLFFMKQEIDILSQPDTSAPFLNQFNFSSGSTSHVATGPNAVQASNTGAGAQLNVASGQSVTQTITGAQVSSLKELTEQLKKALGTEPKLDSQREDIEDELSRIDVQLRKPKPKTSILARSFEALQDLAKDGLGSVGGHAVFELLLRAPKLLESFN